MPHGENVSTSTLSPFNPYSDEHRDQPFELYKRYREHDPVHESIGFWYLFRYDDVLAALKDMRFVHEAARVADGKPEIPPELAQSIYFRLAKSFMVTIDPPAHTRLRGLVNKAFTRDVVDGLRQLAEVEASKLLETLLSTRAEFDLISQFAGPFSLHMIANMLGIPIDDYASFRRWSRDLSATIEQSTAGVLAKATIAGEEMSDYLKQVIANRRTHRRNDLVSRLIDAEENGATLTEDEIIATCMLLLVAGHETTMNLIGNGMYALLQHPDQLQLLREQPNLIRNAVEEFLRYDAPGRIAVRWAAEEVQIGGRVIPRGARVGLVIASANRDEKVFENPERLDVTRDASRHIAFGMGIHYCLGAPLARMEGEVAFRTLLERFPRISLSEDSIEWERRASMRGLKQLQLRLQGS